MTDDKDFARVRIQPLTADNYYVWSNDIEVLLRGKGLWTHAEGTAVAPTTDNDEKAKFQQKKDMCLAYLLTTIDQSCKYAVMKERDPKKV